MSGGAYEARRLVPPQNSGPEARYGACLPRIFAVIMLLDLEYKPALLPNHCHNQDFFLSPTQSAVTKINLNIGLCFALFVFV